METPHPVKRLADGSVNKPPAEAVEEERTEYAVRVESEAVAKRDAEEIVSKEDARQRMDQALDAAADPNVETGVERSDAEEEDSEESNSSTPQATINNDIATKDTFDGFNTPVVKCRLGLEQWQNDNIAWWIKRKTYPLVEYVRELIHPKTQQKYYKVYFHVLLCGKGDCSLNRAKAIQAMNWTWVDERGLTHHLPSHHLIISDVENTPRIRFDLHPEDVNNGGSEPTELWPTLPDGTVPVVYDLGRYIKCSKVERMHLPPLPAAKNEVKIGACITRFWGAA